MSDKLIQALSKLCNCVSWRTDKCAACRAQERLEEAEAALERAERKIGGLQNDMRAASKVIDEQQTTLERARGLQEHPAHVFLPTETRSDGQRTRVPQKAKVVLANELAAALKDAP